MQNNITLYTSPEGNVSVQVQFEDGTFWLTQKRMAELFGVDVRTINEHLHNVFKSGEVKNEATIRKIRIVQQEGVREVSREIDFYHLDAIIAVGYRLSRFGRKQGRAWCGYNNARVGEFSDAVFGAVAIPYFAG